MCCRVVDVVAINLISQSQGAQLRILCILYQSASGK